MSKTTSSRAFALYFPKATNSSKMRLDRAEEFSFTGKNNYYIIFLMLFIPVITACSLKIFFFGYPIAYILYNLIHKK